MYNAKWEDILALNRKPCVQRYNRNCPGDCCECEDAWLVTHCVRAHFNGTYEELFKDIRKVEQLPSEPMKKKAKTAVAATNGEHLGPLPLTATGE